MTKKSNFDELLASGALDEQLLTDPQGVLQMLVSRARMRAGIGSDVEPKYGIQMKDIDATASKDYDAYAKGLPDQDTIKRTVFGAITEIEGLILLTDRGAEKAMFGGKPNEDLYNEFKTIKDKLEKTLELLTGMVDGVSRPPSKPKIEVVNKNKTMEAIAASRHLMEFVADKPELEASLRSWHADDIKAMEPVAEALLKNKRMSDLRAAGMTEYEILSAHDPKEFNRIATNEPERFDQLAKDYARAKDKGRAF